jgi:hypothetical protein
MATKQHWNYELIAAMAAVFIGICALITSVVQTQIMLKQQAASVLPIAQWTWSANINALDSTGTFELQVVNKGIGPALIEQVRILYQGEQLPQDSLPKLLFFKLLKYSDDSLTDYFWTSVDGIVLTAGEKVAMFKTNLPRDGFHLAQRFHHLYQTEKIDLVICYKDVYGKRWQVRRESKITTARDCQIK